MEFPNIFTLYQTALDLAKENNHQEIVELLLKGPISSSQALILPDAKSISRIHELEDRISKLTSENSNLTEQIEKIQFNASKEICQLKSFILSLKEKSSDQKLINPEDYEEGKVIGEGATSTVKKVYKKEEIAKKELKSFDHQDLQRFMKESELLFQLRHPCIVRIHGFDYGDSSHPPSIYLSLEPSSLEQSIQNHSLTKEEKNRITVEIVLGMRYIHSNNFIHRDLKPLNILLSQNNHVRITDFGLAKEEDLATSQTKGVGTLRFMAPELFEEGSSDHQERYTNKVDVYSFGIILIYIITEEYPPFSLRNVYSGIPPALPPTVVAWVVELIQRCLQSSPNDRPTFNEILEILKSHNFDLFNETNSTKPTIQQRKSKEAIEHRILKIEAFEYQHRL